MQWSLDVPHHYPRTHSHDTRTILVNQPDHNNQTLPLEVSVRDFGSYRTSILQGARAVATRQCGGPIWTRKKKFGAVSEGVWTFGAADDRGDAMNIPLWFSRYSAMATLISWHIWCNGRDSILDSIRAQQALARSLNPLHNEEKIMIAERDTAGLLRRKF